MTDAAARVRIDKWLWAARFFKTRALAVEAIDGGKIKVNGHAVKRAKLIQPGDEVRLRLGPYEHHVTVTGVSERRGSAEVAATLYAETDESRIAREKLAWQLKHAAPVFDFPEGGRPTKRDRRKLEKWREGR